MTQTQIWSEIKREGDRLKEDRVSRFLFFLLFLPFYKIYATQFKSFGSHGHKP